MFADLWVTGTVATLVMAVGLLTRAGVERRSAWRQAAPWVIAALAFAAAGVGLSGHAATLGETAASAAMALARTARNQPAAVFGGVAIGLLALPWLRLNFQDEHNPAHTTRYRLLTLALAGVMAAAVMVPLVPRLVDRMMVSQRLEIDLVWLKFASVRGGEASAAPVMSLAPGPSANGNGAGPDRDLVVRGVAAFRSISLGRDMTTPAACDDSMLAKVRDLQPALAREAYPDWLTSRDKWSAHFPSRDPFDTHMMARDWMYALYLARREAGSVANDGNGAADIVEWSIESPDLVRVTKAMTETFCFLQELNKVLLCVEGYVKQVPDHRLVLIDIHRFIRALVIFVSPQDGARDILPALKELEDAGHKLNEDIGHILQQIGNDPYASCKQQMVLQSSGAPRFHLSRHLPYIPLALANLLASVGSYDSAITTLLTWHERYARDRVTVGDQAIPPHLASWVRVRSMTEISRLVDEAMSPIRQTPAFRTFLDHEVGHMGELFGTDGHIDRASCGVAIAHGRHPPMSELVRQNLVFIYLTQAADLIWRQVEGDDLNRQMRAEARRLAGFDAACFPAVALLRQDGPAWEATFRLAAVRASLAALGKAGSTSGMVNPDPVTVIAGARPVVRDARITLDAAVHAEDRKRQGRDLRVRLLSPSDWDLPLRRAKHLAEWLEKVAEAP